ncbi:hypothetical protein [Actinomycetospora aeridis]|uniref:HK97 gp10 family phage protein n=1 Tax=Actinomycetospora aeridis TaxID=3129231 RepID=A0ABU8N1P8_9PSEU
MALRIRMAKARLDNGARDGAETAAEYLLGITQQRVPLETGDLQRTGRVESGARGGKKTHTFNVIYGGMGLRDYAQRQHEELLWVHSPGRTCKYVEGPLNEESSTIKAIMAAAIRKHLK